MSSFSISDVQSKATPIDTVDLINQWFGGIKERNAQALLSLLHPDMVLTTPFQTESISGNMNVLKTFKIFDQCVNNFNYQGVLVDGNIAALRFDGDVGGEHLQGVDFFHFNQEGQVEKIEVMARPLAAVQALRTAIDENNKR